jgi:hypothetical protein
MATRAVLKLRRIVAMEFGTWQPRPSDSLEIDLALGRGTCAGNLVQGLCPYAEVK